MKHPKKAINTVLADFKKLHPIDKEIVVGVSGGVDSAALLFCLSLTKVKIKPVFVFHGIRTKEEELKSCYSFLSLCKKLNINNCFSYLPPVDKIETEKQAREWRYSRLAKSAGNDGVIATAHHADDQLETMLMRLCRGSGISGLSSIPPDSKIPISCSIDCRVIRPMLRITKDDCIDICTQNEIEWHEDVTNSDVNFTRNRLRKDVLPVLKELYPKCSQNASKAALKLRNISDKIDVRVEFLQSKQSVTKDTITIKSSYLRNEKDSILAAYFLSVAKIMNINLGIDKINTRLIEQLIFCIREKNKKSFNWPGIDIKASKDYVQFVSSIKERIV